ncbi:hypothetical protein E1I69_20215 [Bacillus timonensis]|uniref:Uncharacterized protein n=1 Tax=Bacillus timonensis TaxID=1033734 RepID=A0A4S3PKM2_9BACI|nr:hypothetical protein [Bacillus timonensis]THE10011.1 hypothetical protein E1I69_20215 [Bacillus timonensis]
MKKIVMVSLFIFLLLAGGIMIISSGYLNTDQDTLKYEGRIYSNITELDWFEKEKSSYPKGKRIGEIKRNSKSPLLMRNFSATKLPKGTTLYNTADAKEGITPLIILAETESGSILYYRWLPKE